MAFYKILKEIMQEKSMSIPDVSRSTGISDSTLRSIISRKTKSASLEVAFNISKGLNVSLERLNGDPHIQAKELNFYLENTEIDLIKKYRILNNHGKGAVDTLLEYEYEQKQLRPSLTLSESPE
ncbi:MAG: helix-turn-helix transcriptional regulator [Longicatena sp.]